MYYLEIKLDKKEQELSDPSDFISNVINSQDSLGENTNLDYLKKDKLIELGFDYNPNTHGFSMQKDLSIDQLTELAKQIDILENHKLIHGYIELKIYNNELYFWDKALIYEGVDTFEYCLQYHNILHLENLNVLTKSTTINEDLLRLINCTQRYSTPTTEFITQNCMWDKKEGYKILKDIIPNVNEYISQNDVKNY